MNEIGIVDSKNEVVVPGNGNGGCNLLPACPVKKYFFPGYLLYTSMLFKLFVIVRPSPFTVYVFAV